MVKTRRSSRNKRKTTRRMRRCNKGGAPKVDPTSKKSESEKKKDDVKIMAHSLVPAAADIQLSFTPAARDSLIVQGARADHMMRHLGIPRATHHHDPQSAMRAPLESARARVMVNTMIDAIHASVDRLRARGDFANARVQLDRALELGSMRARVELADMLYDGRIGAISRVDADRGRAYALLNVDDPVVRNNPDCMGLRVFFELYDRRARDDDLVRLCNDAVKSARANSKYGMFALGTCLLSDRRFALVRRHHGDYIDVQMEAARAARFFEMSANANYDRAQDALGSVRLTSAERHHRAQDALWLISVRPEASAQADRDRDEALRLFTSAANQGLRAAMNHLGDFYKTEAERLRLTAGDADLRRMISDARHWYQLSDYYCDVEFDVLNRLEMSLDVGNEEAEDEDA